VASLADLLTAAVNAGGVPGAVAAVGQGPDTTQCRVAGQADTTPGSARPMRAGTCFDLASLTKVVATTPVILALAARGALGLDEPAASYLPRFTAGRPVTVRHLLTHTSGLPGSRKFYRWCGSRAELLEDLYQTPLDAPPGSRVAYSDPGFIVLGELVAAVTGSTFDDAARRLVLARSA
jgi:CubicO group peptidase (beta-lactamase class C family)